MIGSFGINRGNQSWRGEVTSGGEGRTCSDKGDAHEKVIGNEARLGGGVGWTCPHSIGSWGRMGRMGQGGALKIALWAIGWFGDFERQPREKG